MKFKSTVVAVACGLVALNVSTIIFAKSAQAQSTTVNLYVKPESSSKVIEAVKPNQNLIAIYQKGGWIKVGNPRDGEVGWINKKEYSQAYTAWYQPNVQTIFVRNEQDKDGKPVVKIVAYSNGKKLNGNYSPGLKKFKKT